MTPPFRQHTLDNGLTIIAEPNDAAHTAAIGFFVKTGARDEQPEVMGVSHFLEHMMFKGTERRTADDVNREFDEIGANYNAFTSHEQTVYFAQVLPEFIPRAVDLLGDMLRPALRADDFDMEKNVILEEIGMYDDRPEWRLQDSILEAHFQGHGLGMRVLGTGGEDGTVTRLTVQQMRDYFGRRYAADNIVLAAAGRLDFDKLVRDLDQRCGRWQPSGAQRDTTAPHAEPRELTIEDDRLARHYLGMLCPAPAAQDESRYAAKVLADVLGEADGSRLYWELIDPGLAEDADFAFHPQDHAGAYMAFATCEPKRAAQVEEKLLATIDAFAANKDITEDEVTRAKNKLATHATLQGERPLGRMQALGVGWTYLGRYIPLEEELANLMAVTPDDVTALLDQFPFTPRTLLRLGPDGP